MYLQILTRSLIFSRSGLKRALGGGGGGLALRYLPELKTGIPLGPQHPSPSPLGHRPRGEGRVLFRKQATPPSREETSGSHEQAGGSRVAAWSGCGAAPCHRAASRRELGLRRAALLPTPALLMLYTAPNASLHRSQRLTPLLMPCLSEAGPGLAVPRVGLVTSSLQAPK